MDIASSRQVSTCHFQGLRETFYFLRGIVIMSSFEPVYCAVLQKKVHAARGDLLKPVIRPGPGPHVPPRLNPGVQETVIGLN